MKLLIDENLSDKLVAPLSDLYPGSQHVKQLRLHASPDMDILERARSQGFTILTQDDDFVEISALKGHPPKVIHLGHGQPHHRPVAGHHSLALKGYRPLRGG